MLVSKLSFGWKKKTPQNSSKIKVMSVDADDFVPEEWEMDKKYFLILSAKTAVRTFQGKNVPRGVFGLKEIPLKATQ